MQKRATGSRVIVSALNPEWYYTRGILRGVLGYAATRSAWRLVAAGAVGSPGRAGNLAVPPDRGGRAVDGWIGFLGRRAGSEPPDDVPAVNVSDSARTTPTARVFVDNQAVGRMAADHLLSRGCEHFAYAGPVATHQVGRRRHAGFAERIGEALSVDVPVFSPKVDAAGDPEALPRWLAGLPRPAGVLCFDDYVGQQTILAAEAAGLSVPMDLAVVGVNDDDLLCRAVRPQLTSIALPLEGIGHRAAALLDRLIDGEPAPRKPIELAPVRVVERASSWLHRVADPMVSRAMAYMHDHLGTGVNVARTARATGVCRRTLEYRFRKALGHSPHAELRRMQCRLAADLLHGTDATMEEIAERCGFSSRSSFSRVFARYMGRPPGAYRRGAGAD